MIKVQSTADAGDEKKRQFLRARMKKDNRSREKHIYLIQVERALQKGKESRMLKGECR
jgi:hypothetical protein